MTIHTPAEVWLAISRKEMNGAAILNGRWVMATAIDSPVSGARAGEADRALVFVTDCPEVLEKRREKREAQDAAS